MRLLLQLGSWAALAATIVPSVLYLGDILDLDRTKWIMLGATVLWFATAPLWIGQPAEKEHELVL